eukprot:764950-Hanusia_phi.AAC.5
MPTNQTPAQVATALSLLEQEEQSAVCFRLPCLSLPATNAGSGEVPAILPARGSATGWTGTTREATGTPSSTINSAATARACGDTT